MDLKAKALYLFIMLFLTIESNFEISANDVVYIKSSINASCYTKETCLTLSQFASDKNWLRKNVTMILLPSSTEDHTLDLMMNVSDISNFSMLSNGESNIFVICQLNARLNFHYVDQIWLRGVWFFGCGPNVFLSVKQLQVEDCTFQGKGDSETAMILYNSNAVLNKTYFFSNMRGFCFIWLNELPTIRVYGGGAVVVNQSDAIFLNCKFEGNRAEIGGAIHAFSAYIDIINSDFVHNYATTIKRTLQCPGPVIKDYQRKGGAINTLYSTLFINNSIFYNNTNWYGPGGAINIIESNVMAINSQYFVNNRAVLGFGGVLFLSVAYVTIHNCTFYNSSSYQGGVAVSLQSYLTVRISTFTNNVAKVIDIEDFRAEGGVIIGDHSQITLAGSQFKSNKARFGGVLVAQRSMVTFKDCIISGNVGGDGGVLNVVQTHVVSMGKCYLINNTGYTADGAVQLSGGCILDVYDTLIITSNKAKSGGGGLALHQSRLNCHYNCTLTFLKNKAGKCGGGVRAFNAIITIYVNRTSPDKSSIKFIENTSTRGGGICLELGAKIVIRKTGSVDINETFHLYYISNSANIGQAIYVNDETNYEMCDRKHPLGAECFLQVLSISYFASAVVTVQFKQNSSIIFGGLLDRCTLDEKVEFIESDIKQPKTVTMDGVTYYLKTISTLNSTNEISSKPVKLCFCREDGIQDCNYQPYSLNDPVHVKKGQIFNVSLVAADQVNHTIMNVAIYSSLSQKGSGLGEGQLTQVTSNACTNLTFSIYSLHFSEYLILYPEGPCRSASLSQKRIYVTFLPCTCPIGFQPKDLYLDVNSTSCTCVCDYKLHEYVTDPDCNPQTQTLARKSNFWITHIEHSNLSDYLMYPHCPFDYCLSPSSTVQINLNLKNGSDGQCSNNRFGLLCENCRPRFSLSLGSSQYLPCGAVWQKHLALILLVSLVSGIVLVVLIMVLNLTVAVGTLNGLIFYANIIHAYNSAIFFSDDLLWQRFSLYSYHG